MRCTQLLEPVMITGRVYRSFKPTRVAECAILLGGRVLHVGSLESCEKACRALGGCIEYGVKGAAIPGFVDSHLHLSSTGRSTRIIELRDCRSIRELVDRIRRAYQQGLGVVGGWVYARGWDQERLGATPSRRDLDQAVPDKPAIAVRVCGHVAVLNTKALELVGLKLAERFRGLIDLEHGVVREEALEEVVEAIESQIPLKEIEEDILRAQEAMLRNGIVACSWMSASLPELLTALKLTAQGRLVIRVSVYLSREAYRLLVDSSIDPRIGVGGLRVRGVKEFCDGSLGARTALLSQPYSDSPETRGVRLLSVEDAVSLAVECEQKGLELALHAIGDAAVDIALEAARRAPRTVRIEHASLVRDDQLPLLAAYPKGVSIQPRFIVSDWWAEKRLGWRTKWLYRIRDMVEWMVELGFSSDSPVEPLNPLEGVYAATCGAEWISREHLVDLETALRLYTMGSARLSGFSDLGAIEPGFEASIVVLDKDPLEVSLEETRRIRVYRTIVRGLVCEPD